MLVLAAATAAAVLLAAGWRLVRRRRFTQPAQSVSLAWLDDFHRTGGK